MLEDGACHHKTAYIMQLLCTYFSLLTINHSLCSRMTFFKIINLKHLIYYKYYDVIINVLMTHSLYMISIQHWHDMKHLLLWKLNILLQHSMKIQGKLLMSLLSSIILHCYFQHSSFTFKSFLIWCKLLVQQSFLGTSTKLKTVKQTS